MSRKDLQGNPHITTVKRERPSWSHDEGGSPASGFRAEPASDSDYHYAGKDIKLNSPNRTIFWYTPSGAKKYRAIYGDLSIKELAPANMAKAP